MLVHSHGFPCGPMVQRDGTGTLDRVRTCIYIVHVSTFPWIPMWSYGTAGWDRHSEQSTYMYIIVHANTFPRIHMWSHGTVGWDRHSGQSTYMYIYSTVAERGIELDFRSPTRFSDFGLRTRFYCGREGHWTRFQISDAIFRLWTRFYCGREGHWTRFQISDAIFRLWTSDAIVRLRISDAIFKLRLRTSDAIS